MTPTLRVHATEARSRANGPGPRFVVWVQGCTLGCPGCFNPATHPDAGGEVVAVDDLVARIAAAADAAPLEGVTISGGEPLQQAAGVLALLRGVRALGRGLSTLIFSGYAEAEIQELPLGPDVLAELDVLIDGRYVSGERLGEGLRGSANQRIRLRSGRYQPGDVEATPVAEIRIDATGQIILTGVDPLKLKRR